MRKNILRNVNFKVFYTGIILLSFNIYIIWDKILYVNLNSQYNKVINVDDMFMGSIIFIILLIVSLSIISYSFSFKSRFSDFGKYYYNLLNEIIFKKLKINK